jgi:hypothetical protein
MNNEHNIFPDRATERLYHRALNDNWDVRHSVTWDSASLARIARPARSAMGQIYAQIHHAEAFALRACGTLLEVTSESWLRQLIVTQTRDEARHIEFFARVLDGLGSEEEPGTAITVLGDELAGLQTLEELLVAGQIIETASHSMLLTGARQSQAMLKRAIRFPGQAEMAGLLASIVNLVGRDESRHIALGLRGLCERIPAMSLPRRAMLERRAHAWCVRVQDLIDELAIPQRRLGLSPEAIRDRIWRVQRHNLRIAGLDIGERTPVELEDTRPEVATLEAAL